MRKYLFLKENAQPGSQSLLRGGGRDPRSRDARRGDERPEASRMQRRTLHPRRLLSPREGALPVLQPKPQAEGAAAGVRKRGQTSEGMLCLLERNANAVTNTHNYNAHQQPWGE